MRRWHMRAQQRIAYPRAAVVEPHRRHQREGVALVVGWRPGLAENDREAAPSVVGARRKLDADPLGVRVGCSIVVERLVRLAAPRFTRHLQAGVAGAGIARHDLDDLVRHIAGGDIVPHRRRGCDRCRARAGGWPGGWRRLQSELLDRARQVLEHQPVGRQIVLGAARLPEALHAPLGVGEGALALGERRHRQHDIGELRRLGHEQVLDHQELERGERLGGGLIVARRVEPDDIHPADAPLDRGAPHLASAQARLRQRRATRPGIGADAHIERAAAVAARQQRDQAVVRPADLAGQQRQARQRLWQRRIAGQRRPPIDDDRVLGAGERPRQGANAVLGDAGGGDELGQREGPQAAPQLLDVAQPAGDELVPLQILLDDHAEQRQRQVRFGAGPRA